MVVKVGGPVKVAPRLSAPPGAGLTAPPTGPAWAPTFRDWAGDDGEAVACPFDQYEGRYGQREARPVSDRVRNDYAQQRRDWEARVARAGGPEYVAPIASCFRNHHAILDDDPEYDDKQQILDDLAGQKSIPDHFDFMPDGLVYVPEFLSPKEEMDLVASIDRHGWEQDMQRRTIQFGFKFEHRIDALLRAQPIPEWLYPVCRRVVQLGYFTGEVNQVIVNEYNGSKNFINPHADRHCFGEKVVTISLLDNWTMTWINARDMMAQSTAKIGIQEVLLTLLERRSIAVFGGAGRRRVGEPGRIDGAQARWKWLHSISRSDRDLDRNMNITRRRRRVSLTLRSVDTKLFQQRIEFIDRGLIDVEAEARKRRKKAPHHKMAGDDDEDDDAADKNLGTQWATTGWVRGGPGVVFDADRAAAGCSSTSPELAIGHEMVEAAAPVHVAEFEVSVDRANLAVGVARGAALPPPLACGAASRGVCPGAWGVAYWTQGRLQTLDGDPISCGGGGASAATALGAHDHVRVTVDYTSGTVAVAVNGTTVFDSFAGGAGRPEGPVVPFVFFNLNASEVAGTRVGLRQGSRASAPRGRGRGRGQGGAGGGKGGRAARGGRGY